MQISTKLISLLTALGFLTACNKPPPLRLAPIASQLLSPEEAIEFPVASEEDANSRMLQEIPLNYIDANSRMLRETPPGYVNANSSRQQQTPPGYVDVRLLEAAYNGQRARVVQLIDQRALVDDTLVLAAIQPSCWQLKMAIQTL